MLKNERLDEIDHRILGALAADGRISMTALGLEVGLSKTPVTARVRRLESLGVITGYRAELSASKLGLEHVAFLEVKLSDTRQQALSDFNDAVRLIPEVESCHMIAGGFDYLLKVRTTDIAAYRRVLGEQISQLPHLASTSTFVSMESVLELGGLQL
ncbi:MAG: Lrp/AsnC ligand binding domain-containing protein [Rhizobiales bacterium]|nr:Lrp/AsnC ligand binding domain-containing protein [Hyphomicrobiales bacterium]MBO6697878.1 Lrp/AsnC ligand binding domain-containing protein [Hyphomicrobiales bacterium]MBO6735868.1 Lrp/AsnC ligand binding domain-containing protein [Hyphomicrobiales bacterium]MBO6913879.1 Lrp/AsnC ligand binding domain-containing protein [Hyphomicrobiales bacterium]MBO6955582.1 Lrp/AsnC ligand binding domain-containing protein [Hyphomicrobiales bacterium]